MRHRKNFFPTLILTILSWLSWLYILFFVSPEETLGFSNFLFFLTLTFSLTFIFSLLFANTRRGFFLTLGLIGFLILRMFSLAHYLNLVLLAATLFSLELYFAVREYPEPPCSGMKRTRIKAGLHRGNPQPPRWGRLYFSKKMLK